MGVIATKNDISIKLQCNSRIVVLYRANITKTVLYFDKFLEIRDAEGEVYFFSFEEEEGAIKVDSVNGEVPTDKIHLINLMSW